MNTNFTSVKLSLYRYLAFILFLITALAIFSVSFIQQATAHASNPFFTYSDIFPGEAQPPETRGFDCKLNQNNHSRDYTICTSSFSKGVFSQIILLIVQNRIYQSTFVVRENRLRFGDLMQNLDMTNLQLYPYETSFRWHDLFITVKTSLMRHATALRPIATVTFSKVNLPHEHFTFPDQSHAD